MALTNFIKSVCVDKRQNVCYWEGDSQRKVGVLEVAEDLRLGKQKP